MAGVCRNLGQALCCPMLKGFWTIVGKAVKLSTKIFVSILAMFLLYVVCCCNLMFVDCMMYRGGCMWSVVVFCCR